jgi:hypothetical protein
VVWVGRLRGLINLYYMDIIKMDKMNSLDRILLDIDVHLNPELLLEEYKSKIDNSNTDKEKLKTYDKLFWSVKKTYEKIEKYELYFAEFYPTTEKITKFEALDHHIHAYLEDLDILKNKIVHSIQTLKNDLKRIATNKKEIDEALNGFVERIRVVFDGVSANRHPHHHVGMRFCDGNLVESEMMHIMIQKDFPLHERINTEVAKRREEDLFNKARQDWIGVAHKNNEQILGLINEVFKRNNDFIYKVLCIKTLILDSGSEAGMTK